MKSLLGIAIFLFSISLSAQKDGDYHLDKVFDLSPQGTIELTSSDAKVFVTGSTRSNVHLKIDRVVTTKGLYVGRDEFAIEINDEGGNLKIRENSSSYSTGIVGYYNEDYEIRIEAPLGASLVIKGDDGDYSITQINGSVSMSVDDGNIDLTGCKGSHFAFRLDDGDLRMDEGKGTLELNIDDGDVEIKNGQFKTILADIDDGDFIIETSLADDGKYNIRAQDGLVSMMVSGGGGQFDIRHDDARIVADEGFSMKEESETFTALALPNGTANVQIRTDDAKVRLAKR